MLKFIPLFVLLSVFQHAFAEESELNQTIAHLLNFVETSECTFIRNGKSYTVEEAAEHIRKKYDYFKDEIDTPEKFIELAATKSSMSDKPYFVNCGEDASILSSDWLMTELANYRESLKKSTQEGNQEIPND